MGCVLIMGSRQCTRSDGGRRVGGNHRPVGPVTENVEATKNAINGYGLHDLCDGSTASDGSQVIGRVGQVSRLP
jgi:hypothetical protein